MAIRGDRVFVGAAALLLFDAKLNHLGGGIVLTVSTPKGLLGGHTPRRITLTSRASRRLTSGLMLFDDHSKEVELAKTGFGEDDCTCS